MKCLVTGATGFIGRSLCTRLAASGVAVIGLGRQASAPSGVTDYLNLDLSRDLPGPAQLAGVSTVCHLAGIAHQRALKEDYQRVNVDATLALAHAALAAGVEHFVFFSSVKAMGPADLPQARSEPELAPATDPYGASKRQAEEGLQALFGQGPARLTILRPALVYGPGVRGNLGLLARASQWGMPRPPAIGARSMVSLEDMVSLACTAIHRTAPGHRLWIATDGEAYSTRHIHDLLRRALGRGPAPAWLPEAGWRALAGTLDLCAPAPEPRWQKWFGTELYSNAAVLRDTDWRPRQTLADVLLPGGGQ